MKVIIQDTAHDSIDSIFEYLSNYSIENALETIEEIYARIYELEKFAYIGRYVPEIRNNNFRELILRRTRQSGYRIIYYIAQITNTIYIIDILNCRQNFNVFLKQHNYFK